MGEQAVHVSRVRVYQDRRPLRRAYIADFPEPVQYSLHSGAQAFYRMELPPHEQGPTTLDHLVAAAAG